MYTKEEHLPHHEWGTILPTTECSYHGEIWPCPHRPIQALLDQKDYKGWSLRWGSKDPNEPDTLNQAHHENAPAKS